MARDYQDEYKKFQSSEEQKKYRAARNKARREGERTGRVSKGDGKDIDHMKPLSKGGSTVKGNTRVVSRSTNRAKKNG
jgi:hypothetical protein